jgi:hypothetical protein
VTRLWYQASPIGRPDVGLLQQAAARADSPLGRAAARWREGPWEAYRRGLLHQTERTLRFRVRVLTTDPDVVYLEDACELVVDDSLFVRVAMLYGLHGWRGVESLLACLKDYTEHLRRLVRAAVEALEPLIADELVAIEAEATRLAARERAAMDRALRGWQAQFRKDDYHRTMRLNIPREDELILALREARRLQKRIAPWSDKLRERAAKDGGGARFARRERERYRQALVDTYLAKQRPLLDELAAVQARIGAVFPPALLIVHDLDDDVRDWRTTAELARGSSSLQRTVSLKREVDYEQRIYAALGDLLEQVDVHGEGLASPGIARVVATAMGERPERRWNAGGLHRYALTEVLREKPTAGDLLEASALRGMIGVWFTLKERREYAATNRVLGRPAVLERLLTKVEAEQPATWRQVVLHQYRLDLERELEQRRQDAAFVESLWHCFEVTLAVAGVLLAVVGIPFGVPLAALGLEAAAVAVPAALTAALGAATLVTGVLGIVLAVRGVLALIQAGEQTSTEIRGRLVELGQVDPAAFAQLASLCARRRIIFRSASGLLGELVALAAAHRLRPVAFALDMRGYLDDLEMLDGGL